MTIASLVMRHLWIGFCALSMLAQTRLMLDLSHGPTLLDGFVFGCAVFAYGFTHPDRRVKTGAWLAGIFGAISYAASATAAPAAGWQTAVLVPAVLWLAYYGLRRPGNAGLRAIPPAKPFVVALAWGWVTVMLPLPPEMWPEAAGILVGRSAFIFALALAYDLADLDYDRRHGLKTWAAQLGLRRTFGLIGAALAIAVSCSIINAVWGVYGPETTAALTASLLFSAWCLWRLFALPDARPNDWRKWWVDALMPVQFLILLFVKNFIKFDILNKLF